MELIENELLPKKVEGPWSSQSETGVVDVCMGTYHGR